MVLDNRLIMIRYESGERILVAPTKDAITSDNIIFVLDEKNNTVWTWLGKNTSNIEKRGAKRIARGLKSSGYTYQEYIVAPQAKHFIVIDENKIKDPEIQNNFNTLTETLNKAQLVDEYLANIPFDGPISIDKAEITDFKPQVDEIPTDAPSKTVQSLTAPVVEEEPKPEPKSEPQEKSETPSTPLGDKMGEIKAGLLIFSTLKQFSEIYTIIKDNEIRIEGAVEPLAKFTLKGNELTVSPELKFAGQQEEVLKKFRELNNLISK